MVAWSKQHPAVSRPPATGRNALRLISLLLSGTSFITKYSVSLTNGFTYIHRRHGPTHPSWCYLRCPHSATCRRPRRHGHPGLRSTGGDSQRTWWRPAPCLPCGWTATLCPDGPLWPSDRVSYPPVIVSVPETWGNLLSGTSSSAQWFSAAFLAPDCAVE